MKEDAILGLHTSRILVLKSVSPKNIKIWRKSRIYLHRKECLEETVKPSLKWKTTAVLCAKLRRKLAAPKLLVSTTATR